jgi:CRP-like cAMP-binding protein
MPNSWDQFQDLFKYFERFVKFTDDEKMGFATLLHPVKFKKGEVITEVGSVEKHLSFISTGIVRGYCMKGNDDITCCIEFSNTFISAYGSFTEQSPSLMGLEALTDITLYQMKYNDLQGLYASSKEGERMGRMAAEQMSAVFERRIVDMLTKSTLDRYEQLLESEPHLILTVPQKYIAEYLGIQPESLSRLKKQVAK